MKKYILFVLITILMSIEVLSQTVFSDNFDTYTAGQQIACQSAGVWKTWSNIPCSAVEDAYVSNVYSFSGSNSVVIVKDNDVVREIGTPITSGIAEINFQVFIPTGKSGYFNTLSNFNPIDTAYVWAMEAFFDSFGNGTLNAAGENSATFSYPQNQWFSVKVVADLNTDIGEFWINDTKIYSWQWSKGYDGTGTSKNDKRLDANDFYGDQDNSEMYIDDYNIVTIPSSNKVSSKPTGGNWSSGNTWVGGSVPTATQTVQIVSGATVTLTSNITNRNASTIVNGTLVCGNFYLSGSGSFFLSGGGALQIGSAAGITSSGSTGNIRVTGTRNFNKNAEYIYNGSVAQFTGNGLPSTVKSLKIINTAGGVTLSNNTSVSDVLNLNGNILTNSNTLSLGTSITNLGTLVSSAGSVLGNFKRWLSNSASVLYPVGTSPSKQTPVTLNNVVGSGTFSVSAVAGVHPNATGTNVLKMYWKLTNDGITSTDLTFNYLEPDVAGNESQYIIGRYDGAWAFPSPFSLNTTTNTVRINGVNVFSDWTLGEPTALPVELTSFSASVNGSSVELTWATATEVNNYGFEIERSRSNKAWTKITFVKGYGNSNSPKEYSFTDKNINSGKYSYRLKQIDLDGSSKYSNEVEATVTTPDKFGLDQNYPNPFNPTTTIKYDLPKSSKVKLVIYNSIGMEIAKLVDGEQAEGTHTVNWQANDFPSGIYFYKLQASDFLQTRKMLLLK